MTPRIKCAISTQTLSGLRERSADVHSDPQPSGAIVTHFVTHSGPEAAVVGGPPAAHTVKLAPMKYSVPTHIDIPAVNLHADIIEVDANPDGSLGTPPLRNAKVAGWYDGSVAPGQAGASVMDAHVDSNLMKDHRGAFFYLGLTRPGIEIDVTRADHTVSVFAIDEVQVALKTRFPTDRVYGDTAYPSLRLITCGGDFDRDTHEYLGNTIVYAHLTGERRSDGGSR